MSSARTIAVIFVALAMPLVVVLDAVLADQAAAGISRSQCRERDAADRSAPGGEPDIDAAAEDGAGGTHDEPWQGCRGAAGPGILAVAGGFVTPASGLLVPRLRRRTGIIRGPPTRG